MPALESRQFTHDFKIEDLLKWSLLDESIKCYEVMDLLTIDSEWRLTLSANTTNQDDND